MWYKKSFRRHLCDMHIDDWNEQFLSKFSPEEYVKNLKKAKIQNAMLYFQSHVGLCYYPTKSGKMHNGFIDKPDAMRKLVDLCHESGISVTGYYSLIFNTWAHDNFPDWKMVGENGLSRRDSASKVADMEFSDSSKTARYGLCCPNNQEYRRFVLEQIKEMSEYFTVEGMFYDMLYWNHMCYCESCKKRWAKEVGGEIPTIEDWNDNVWLLHMRKRREWIGEFAQWITTETKNLFPGVSVEHNVAYSALPNPTTGNCEEVIVACDYAGGDLYRGIYSHSFACKFYRNITNNQPFEYMFSRCAPNLAAHTQIKSPDIMSSSIFLTAAHHGATLVIDAIDPIGTMDSRVYSQLGEIFGELIPYEPYLIGEPLEDIGLYYSLKGKYAPNGESYTNYIGVNTALETMIINNIPCGVTGGFHNINKYKILVAPMLTIEDDYDVQRITEYVKSGGNLYFSGANNHKLIKEFFGTDIIKRTEEKVVYISPESTAQSIFEYFNSDYPLNFNSKAAILENIDADDIIATLTLPYTAQNTKKFASIHSNPPGIKTDIPAIVVKKYGKGSVIWSALPIECVELYDYRIIFINLLKNIFDFCPTVNSDAPKDVEITTFMTDDSILVNTVLLNTDYEARKVESFNISINCDKKPKSVCILPENRPLPCTIDNNKIIFRSENFKIFNMYKISF